MKPGGVGDADCVRAGLQGGRSQYLIQLAEDKTEKKKGGGGIFSHLYSANSYTKKVNAYDMMSSLVCSFTLPTSGSFPPMPPSHLPNML